MKLLLTCLLAYLLFGIGNLMAYPTTPSGDAIREWEPNRDYTIDTVVWEGEDFYKSIVLAHTSSPTFPGDRLNWVEMSDDLNRLLDGQGVHNAVAVWTSTSGDDIRTTSVFIDELDNMFGIQELSVTGNTLIGGSLFLTGSANIEGALNLTGNASLLADLAVEGTTTVKNIVSDGFLNMSHQVTPGTPTVGTDSLYIKADHKLYRLDEFNVENLVGLELSSTFDNRLIKSDGTGGSALEESGIIVNDDDSLFDISHFSLLEIATPLTPTVGSDKLYFKSDGKLYKLDTAGIEKLVGLENTSVNDSRLMVSDGTTAEAIRESSVTVNADAISGVSTLSMTAELNMTELALGATPDAGMVAFYPKSDGKLYRKDDTGTESIVGLEFTSSLDNKLIVSDGTTAEAIEETTITVDPITGDMSGVNDLTISGITYAGVLELAEVGTPSTPATGTVALYFNTSGNLYKKNNLGSVSPIGGAFPVAIIKDEEVSGATGGGCTAGSYQTREFEVLTGDTSFISIGSSQMTLDPGTYFISVVAQTYQIDQHKMRLRNITDALDIMIGSSSFSKSGADQGAAPATLMGEFTIAATKVIEIQHRCGTTKATNGFGTSSGFGEIEVFLEAWIEKRN